MMDDLIEWCEPMIRHTEREAKHTTDPIIKKYYESQASYWRRTAQALRELQSCREENERLRGKLGRIKAHCHHHKTMSKTLLRNTVQLCYEEAAMTSPTC